MFLSQGWKTQAGEKRKAGLTEHAGGAEQRRKTGVSQGVFWQNCSRKRARPMEFGCTFPLQRAARLKGLPYGQETDRFFCWDLHCLNLQGRRSLVGTNCKNRFAFVLFGLSHWDWQALQAAAVQGIYESLAAGISLEAAQWYCERIKTPALTRTHGRREVAFLNRMIEELLRNDGLLDLENGLQPLLESVLNGIPCRAAGEEGMEAAAVRMRRELAVRKLTEESEGLL